MLTLADRLERLIRAAGLAAAWLCFAMVVVMSIVVAQRYLFDAGSIRMQESIAFMHAAAFMLAAAYTLAANDHVRVDVSHDKVHAQDARGTGGKIDSFHRTVYLEGTLDQAQRDRLLEIADRCPVHQTLERANHIKTTLAQ